MNLDKIKDKIQKLIALANGASTDEEAATAMGRVQELIATYRLDPSIVDAVQGEAEEEDYGKLGQEIINFGKRLPMWRTMLLHYVAQANECQILVIAGQGWRLIGHDRNRQTVKYINQLFSGQVDRLAKANAYGMGRTYSANYRMGVVDAIDEKLSAANRDAQETAYLKAGEVKDTNALIRLDQLVADARERITAVELATKARCGKGKYNSGGTASNHGYSDGRRDGKAHVSVPTKAAGMLN